MATVLRRPDAPFTIGVSCPGCGSEVDLEQGFFVTTCKHCGSVLRVLAPDVPPAFCAVPKIDPSRARVAVDRYLKAQGLPLTSSQHAVKSILYPYWKIDALAVKVRHVTEDVPVSGETDAGDQPQPGQQSRRTVSLAPYTLTVSAGVIDDLVPASIGLRAGYLKLRPYDANLCPQGYEALRIVREWGDALARAESSTRAITNSIGDSSNDNRTDLLCARASIIYFPYLIIESYGPTVRRAVVDAVSGRVAGCDERSMDEIVSATPESESQTSFGQLGIEFHRCATCGQNLPSEPSYLYACRNCGRLTRLGPAKGIEIENVEPLPDDLLVPFWRITSATGAASAMIPAFRIANAEAGYRLAHRMTGAAPRLRTIATGPSASSQIAPVNVDASEARVLADVVSFRHALERNENAKFVESGPPQATSLVFVPFHPDEYFWVDSVLGAVTFERALLRCARGETVR
jgi:DNA-directed RNA polymerase subunit RPC12/RpoP